LFFFCRFRLFLFFLCRRFLRWRFLAFASNERNLIADVYLAAFLDINFGERSVFGGFPFHGCLIGLDFGEHFTSGDFVPLLFLPCDQSTLGHRVA
jgi:hypothetical protein